MSQLICIAGAAGVPGAAADSRDEVSRDEVSRDEAAEVARRWATAVAAQPGGWAGSPAPEVREIEPLRDEGVLLGWRCRMAPDGWVVVSARRELSPIKACGERGTGAGLAALIRDDLRDRTTRLDRIDAASLPEHPAWARLFSDAPAAKDFAATVGPLLETRWAQGWPYNELCPMGDGGRTYVGCTALAAAQLMRFHAWPERGLGQVAYWWDGDDVCGGDTPGDTLRADLSDSFDWEAMGLEVGAADPPESRAAVAELCYETAAACQMDFSACGSAASLARARSALVDHLRYLPTASERQRFRLNDEVWFDLIRADLDRGLPLLYASTIHTMVCDGWRELDGLRQVHINYGWAGESDGWFALDSVETSLNPQAERLLCGLEPDDATPVVLDAFRAERTPLGARLTWDVSMVEAVDGLHVWRAIAGGDRVRLTDAPLSISEHMSWHDPSPPSVRADYWLEERFGTAGTGWHGPAILAALGLEAICSLSAPSPNPCNPATTVRLRLGRPGAVRADVVDVRGRRVARLLDALRPAGETVLRWDGRADDGREAPSGIYVLRIEANESIQSRKVLLTR